MEWVSDRLMTALICSKSRGDVWQKSKERTLKAVSRETGWYCIQITNRCNLMAYAEVVRVCETWPQFLFITFISNNYLLWYADWYGSIFTQHESLWRFLKSCFQNATWTALTCKNNKRCCAVWGQDLKPTLGQSYVIVLYCYNILWKIHGNKCGYAVIPQLAAVFFFGLVTYNELVILSASRESYLSFLSPNNS